LEAWVRAIRRVVGRTSASMACGSSTPWGEQCTTETATPCLSNARKGRMTELCSTELVMTWSPGRRMPASARLSASVALEPKTMRSGSSTPSSVATCSRAW